MLLVDEFFTALGHGLLAGTLGTAIVAVVYLVVYLSNGCAFTCLRARQRRTPPNNELSKTAKRNRRRRKKKNLQPVKKKKQRQDRQVGVTQDEVEDEDERRWCFRRHTSLIGWLFEMVFYPTLTFALCFIVTFLLSLCVLCGLTVLGMPVDPQPHERYGEYHQVDTSDRASAHQPISHAHVHASMYTHTRSQVHASMHTHTRSRAHASHGASRTRAPRTPSDVHSSHSHLWVFLHAVGMLAWALFTMTVLFLTFTAIAIWDQVPT
jgi:hypothetical protein